MAQIKISLPGGLVDGQEIKFKAPCDCTAVTGILVSYYDATGAAASKGFTFRDSLGNDLTGLGSLFAAGAYVKASLDTGNGYAYLLNVTGKVPASKIDGTIPASKIASGAVTTAKIGSGAVTTEKIKDGAVTPAKLSEAIPISNGGTGANNRATAHTNLVYLGGNPVTEETDTYSNWKALGFGVAYISGEGVLKEQPSIRGYVYNYTVGGSVGYQVYHDCSSDDACIYHRACKGSDWGPDGWIKVWDAKNLNPATLDSNGKVTAEQISADIVSVSASATLDASHCGKFLSVNSTSAVTLTIPDSTNLPVGTEIEILRFNKGAVSIKGAATIYLRCIGSSAVGETYNITDRYGIAVIKKVADNAWVIAGAVEKA